MTNLNPLKPSRVGIAIGVVLLLAVMSMELALSVRHQSQTFDEACHIFAGVRYWKNSDFGMNPEHPPLVKLLATAPLLSLPLRMPPVPDEYFRVVEYEVGRQFLYDNDANSLLWRARLAAAILTIALGVTIFLVANSMWGTGPAFLALALFAFEPNFLAHGALVTTDIGVTLGLFLGVASFYRFSKKPSVQRLAAAGLAAGFCLSVKHSGILIFPMLFCLAIAELLPLRDAAAKRFSPELGRKAVRQAGALAAITAISLVVLWSMYGFRYSARRAGETVNPSLPEYTKQAMGTTARAAFIMQIARLHIVPQAYLYGVVDIYAPGDLPTVMFGKYYPKAQWFYFPAIFLIKSTLAFLLLCCLAPLSGALRDRAYQREVLFLVIPCAVYLVVALLSGINYGVRHLLPVFPFLIVLVASGAWNLSKRHRALAAVVAVLVAFHAVSSMRAFPNYIPYSNELWGGPENTHKVLADSNVDWGQGLKAMKQYIDEHHVQDCWFAYFGALVVNVSYYGIPCKRLPIAFEDLIQFPMQIIPPQVDGPVFISSTEVSGTYWRSEWGNPYLPFQQVPPSALIAGSILVYDGKVDISQVSALTHENLATRLLKAGKTDEALAEAEAAIAAAPNRPLSHGTRSLILSAMGRRIEASGELEKARVMASSIIAGR
jgi:4-amino-4-deoxy-L-arabinose transferase-like glycosyltransferase